MKTILIILLFLPFFTSAHGLATSLSQESNDYIIRFEYSTPGNPLAGDFTTFDVDFLSKDKDPVSFDSVYLKISKTNGEPALVATSLKESADLKGNVRISGIIKDSGDYTADIIVRKDGKNIPAKFNLTVNPWSNSPNATQSRSMISLVATVTFIIGFFLALIVRNKNKSNARR